MRFLLLFLALLLATPALAAEVAGPAPVGEAKLEAVPAEKQDKASEPAAPQTNPGEFVSPYFTVKLPEDWQAILPPTEQQGVLNAIFAKSSQDPIVTMIVMPHGGTDPKIIAEMFAEQFKAAKAPVEKNGQYTFAFTQGDTSSNVWVTSAEDVSMVTTISGNQKAGLEFIKKCFTSEKYARLFPR